MRHRKQLFNQDFLKCYYCQPASLCVRHNPVFEEIRKVFSTAELICGLPEISKLNLDLDSTPKAQ